jgi:hypothetical protein
MGDTQTSVASLELEQAKAAIELKTAEAAVEKERRERVEAESPLASAKREAEDQKAIDEAQLGSAESRQKQVSALIPDLSKVTPDKLEVKGETPLFGPSLAQRATTAAAARVALRVGETLGSGQGSARILVTSDAQLAASDAIYVEVLSGLDELITAAGKVIGEVEPPAVEAAPPDSGHQDFFAAGVAGVAVPVVKALAAALPGAISLLTAHHTLSTSPVTADSFAAAAVVAGELSQRTPKPAVFHDDFRLLPEGGAVLQKLSTLADERQKLTACKTPLEETKSTESARLGGLNAAVKGLEEKLHETKKSDREPVRSQLEGKHAEIEACEVAIGKCAVRLALIDSTAGAIDQFTTSLRTTAEGAAHSPLTAAILREQLHGDCRDEDKFTHVLLVKAESGSAQQLIDDRPLMFKDRFSTIATTSVTYMLIETEGSTILRSGSIGGEATIEGTVGKSISVVKARAMAPTE